VERVLDKERANFCELFDPTDRPSRNDPGVSVESLRQRAEDLFE
jgi:hypothetical protein